MKKSVVILLVVVALVVLVSPGIVGRLAERSMDHGLDLAAREAADVTITSERYDRGWFSSEGRHRLEIRDGTLRDLLVAVVEPADPEELPALIIDTRLDHGLIPVASMGRDKGSLLPGLGSAVSTLRFEFPGGESIAVPGSVYSSLGVTGEVESSYALEPGSYAAEGGDLRWGAGSIVLTSRPVDGRLAVHAALDPITVESPGQALQVGAVTFDLAQTPSRFGFPTGDARLAVESLSLVAATTTTLGPLAFEARSHLDDDRVMAESALRIAGAPLGPLGAADLGMELRLANADAAALARLQRGLDDVLTQADPQIATAMLEADVQRLLAAGIELHIDRLTVELAEGTIAARSVFTVAESKSTAWPAVVLALDATLDVTLPAAVFDRLAAMQPELQTLVALGYLERRGDDFAINTELSNGRLTINGAPMQLPLDFFR